MDRETHMHRIPEYPLSNVKNVTLGSSDIYWSSKSYIVSKSSRLGGSDIYRGNTY